MDCPTLLAMSGSLLEPKTSRITMSRTTICQVWNLMAYSFDGRETGRADTLRV